MSVRFGDTPTPDGSWTAFVPVASSGASISGNSRYAQYAATLSDIGTATPIIHDVTLEAQGPAVPSLSVGDLAVSEDDGHEAILIVTLSDTLPFPVTVNYSTRSGTASAPGDYAAQTGSVSIASGTTSAQIAIPIVADAAYEADETFFVDLSAPTNATIADAQATVSLLNDDQAPTVSIGDMTVTEDTDVVVFTAVLSTAVSVPVSVNYATSEGTAGAADFASRTGVISIAPST